MRPFGQHFLVDEKVVQCLMNQLQGLESKTIVEIGAGKGFITKYLLQNGFKVLAYEIDKKIADELMNIDNTNLEIRVKDFLDVSFQELPNLSCCVGSIPYQISSLLIRKIIGLSFQRAVLIVQKEFADKLTALPSTKRYTFITVLAQSYYSIRKVYSISKNSFSPPPKVNSAIIVMDKKQQVLRLDEYSLFVRKLFTSPNKTVKNVINLPWNISSEILEKRVRDLLVEEVIELYKVYKEWSGDKSRAF